MTQKTGGKSNRFNTVISAVKVYFRGKSRLMYRIEGDGGIKFHSYLSCHALNM